MSFSVHFFSFGTEVSNDEFVISDNFFETIAVNRVGWRSRIFNNVVYNSIFDSSTFVVRWDSSFEEFEGWETLDSESFSKLLVFGDIDLSKAEWRFFRS
jgi:hypothetical protein